MDKLKNIKVTLSVASITHAKNNRNIKQEEEEVEKCVTAAQKFSI